MATTNLFNLLGADADDVEDTSLLIQTHEKKKDPLTGKVAAGKKDAPPPKLPSKPLPPSQAVREARNETGRGGAGRGGRGYGRGRGSGGANRDLAGNEGSFANDNGNSMGFNVDRERFTERQGPRGGFRGGRRGGFSNGDAAEGERPRRVYERRSGTGRGGEIKRDGAGRGNWGTPADETAPETEEPVVENNPTVVTEKQSGEETVDAEKENPVNESEEKEPEEKQMTLEEYEKVLEEKRKSLLSLKGEERKVDLDKEFESMQLVSKKKNDDEVFIKLGSDKDKKKDAFEKEERAKKSVSINEFLKATEGDTYYRPGGRGRGGRGRGGGGGGGGGNNVNNNVNNVPAPSIEDARQFPSLGGK